MSSRVTDRDRGAKALLKHFRGSVTIQAGVVGRAARVQHPKADMSVGELAAIHELGIGVPRCSFLRGTFDQHQSETKKDLRQVPRAAASGNSPQRAADSFGSETADDIVAAINAIDLVDTGTLRDAVGFETEVDQ